MINLDRADWRAFTPVRQWLGVVMGKKKRAASDRPAPLDVVALLVARPAEGLARGQVGTVVEELDPATVLVEFSDDQGRAYAVTPCPCARCARII